jgi:anti-sigma factor RsiW
MFNHIPDEQMEAFGARALKVSEMGETAEHIAACSRCQWRFQETLKRERGDKPVSVSLSLADWFRHEHLDYDQLESFAENRLDAEDTAIVNLHLETCAVCREDVRSFLGFKAATENEPPPRREPEPRSPAPKKPVSERKPSANRWKPVYTVAALFIIGSAILAATLFSRQGATGQQPEPSRTASTGSGSHPAAAPSAPVTPNPTDSGEGAIASLVDGERIVRFNEAGVVSGLETFPEQIRQDITEALLTGEPKRSADLSELLGGEESGSAAGLQYPRRIVITEDRPTFRWAPIAGASSYQVRVNDPNGNQIANSGQLPSDITQWKSAARLRRGIIYSWGVSASVSGEEVAARVSFKLLGGEKLGELAMLKDQYQSHLALGLFYIREGVLIEARREMELLVKDNPNSPVAAKLLRQSQSWR